jgi:hypothetical protein
MPGSMSTPEQAAAAADEPGELCRLAAECVRHVQATVRKVADVAKEHAMPPRNPLPYVLGYAATGALVAGLSLSLSLSLSRSLSPSATGALVAGCIYYNRATLVPRARAAAGWLREVCTDFTKIHVVEPVKNIYTELVYRYLSRCLPFSPSFSLSLCLSLMLVCSVDLPPPV